MPNLSLLVARLRGRATCVLARNARVLAQARIVNLRNDSRLISIGEGSVVRGELLVYAHGGEIVVGDHCYIGPGTRLWSAARISLGNFVLIAHNVDIFDNLTHPLDPVARRSHFRAILHSGHPKQDDLAEASITIGDDVWIAAGACIMRGITIGSGAVIAARAVVTADVPPLAVVAGNPARTVRYLPRPDGFGA